MVSLTVIYTITNKSSAAERWLVDKGRQLQLNFREFSIQTIINVQRWMCQLSTSVPKSPYCDICLSWDCHCSPFLPFASRTMLQNFFNQSRVIFSRDLDYESISGMLKLNCLRYCPYNLEKKGQRQ